MLRGTRSRRHLVAYYFVMPLTIVLLLVNTYPMLYSLFLSFSQWDAADLLAGPKLTGITNFQKMLTDARLWGSVRFMIIFVVVSLVCEIIVGMSVALLLHSRLRFRSVFRSVIILPMAIAPLIAGLTWRSLLNYDYGFLNFGLSLVGIEPVPWLSRQPWTHISIVLVDVWQNMPFVTIVLLAGLQAIPVEYVEAARIDGATPWQIFWRILLPLLRPALMVAVIIRATNLVRMFDLSYVLTGGGPVRSTETFSFVAYMEAFGNFEIPYAAAISWFIFLLNIIITLAFMGLLYRRTESRR